MEDIEKSYKVLELPTNASFQEVKKAYRELSFVWHPDRFPDSKPELKKRANEKLQEINKAYQVLKQYCNRQTESFSTTYPKQPQQSNSAKTAQKHSTQNSSSENKSEVLISKIGVNYTKLKSFLVRKQWKEADQETSRIIIYLIDRYNIENIPCEDLRILNKLWQINKKEAGVISYGFKHKIHKKMRSERFLKKISTNIFIFLVIGDAISIEYGKHNLEWIAKNSLNKFSILPLDYIIKVSLKTRSKKILNRGRTIIWIFFIFNPLISIHRHWLVGVWFLLYMFSFLLFVYIMCEPTRIKLHNLCKRLDQCGI